MAISPKSKIKANVVAFLVLAVFLVYAMATQVLTILQDTYSVYAIFPDAGGVFTNQEVTYRGVTVGRVGTMEVVEEGVRLELSIESDVEIPEEDVQARVMFRSAVGEQFVDLLPESDDPPYLEHGSVIPLGQTSIPVSTQELLTTIDAVLAGVPPEALRGAVDSLGLGLTGTGPDLASLLRSTSELARTFAESSDEITGILQEGTKVGRVFLDTRQEFAAAIRELVRVGRSLAGSTGDLQRLLEGTNVASDEVMALLADHRQALNELVKDLAQVNALQASHRDDLNRLLRNLPDALDAVTSTFEPETAMIRFGLVDDLNRPGCDYGTDRRRPEDRGNREIPEDARCDTTDEGAVAPGPAPVPRGATDAPATLLGGLGGLTTDVRRTQGLPVLPSRMADWSWTLFYLNVM